MVVNLVDHLRMEGNSGDHHLKMAKTEVNLADRLLKTDSLEDHNKMANSEARKAVVSVVLKEVEVAAALAVLKAAVAVAAVVLAAAADQIQILPQCQSV